MNGLTGIKVKCKDETVEFWHSPLARRDVGQVEGKGVSQSLQLGQLGSSNVD